MGARNGLERLTIGFWVGIKTGPGILLHGLVGEMRPILRTSGLAATAAAAALAIGVPLAMAAPTAVPPSDTGGYVNSTARCTAPDTAVLFGSTKTSRIAICKTASGYEYRGVRVSDGAKLIAAARQTSDDSYAVETDGVKYTITPTALSVTANGDTFRTETWTDYHGPKAAAAAPKSSAAAESKPSTATTPGLKTPGAPAAAPGTAAAAAPAAPPAPPTPTSVAPLPPPLAAEVGGAAGG